MTKIGLVFPGQGSQVVGMGKSFFENSDLAVELYRRADKVLGINISEICFNGPDEELKKTQNTQPAILVTSMIALEVLKREMPVSYKFVAGHSLGEYSALYAAGVLSFESTLQIVKRRAELMSLASEGSMAAIIGFKEDALEKIISELAQEDIITVANYNSPDQVVISGSKKAIEKACLMLKESGAKRAIPLPVSGGFHSLLMKNFAEDFNEELSMHKFESAKCSVITNIDALITLDNFQAKLVKQLYSSVMWTQTIETMSANGVNTFIEVGPGKVLSGLIKKINKNSTIYNIESMESLITTTETLKGLVKV